MPGNLLPGHDAALAQQFQPGQQVARHRDAAAQIALRRVRLHIEQESLQPHPRVCHMRPG
jgi:hypothetical protein